MKGSLGDKKFVLTAIMIASSCFCFEAEGQIDKIIDGAEQVADMAELAAITADILEATSYTKDKLEECNVRLSDLKKMVESPQIIQYMPERGRRSWATKIKNATRTVELYNTLLLNILKVL